MKTFQRLLGAAGALVLSGTVIAQGHHYTLLHHFTGGTNDGASPQGSLTLNEGTLYGMTLNGGNQNLGTIFKINLDGTGFAVLHSFAGGTADGNYPYGSLTSVGSTLYGMTYSGGAYGLGTIFQINTDGTGFAIVHSFAGGTVDGSQPYGALTLSGTTLYGMTFAGGSYGIGTIFRLNSDGTGFALLHSFAGNSGNDGSSPRGALTLWGTTLYGLTPAGGGPYVSGASYQYGNGTLFSIAVDGTGYQVVYRFLSRTGVDTPTNTPYGSLTLVGTWFYGTTTRGGHSDHGSVFVVRPEVQDFWQFSGSDGASPRGTVVWFGDWLYGLTPTTVFKLKIDGTGGTVLHSFGGFGDGAAAYGDLTMWGPTYFGMTSAGGSNGLGTVFAIAPNGPQVTSEPSSQTLVAGNSATFTVAATAAIAPAYQWQRQAAGTTTWANLSDGSGYSGAQTATLTVNPATEAMNGDAFRCIADNGNGQDTSVAVTLTVTNAVVVTGQPANQSLAAGNATFSVTASGLLPLTYQWQRQAPGSSAWSNLSEGSTYSGTASASLTVNGVTTAMSGDLFRCVVSNSYGNDMSAPAALVVPVPLTVGTFAGQGGHAGASDGAGSAAQFYGPADLGTDNAGNLYVADTYNDTIRKITRAGVVSTIAGYAGASGSADGTAAAARFSHPAGLTLDIFDHIYVADTDNNTIRTISASGVVATLAGQTGVAGSADGTGSAAQFNGPTGLATDLSGNLYVADTLNHTVRKVTPAGVVMTIAGAAGFAGSADGAGSAARFFGPQSVSLDPWNNLYVADTNNSTIRKIALASATVTTVAGMAGVVGSVDGPCSMARFHYPSSVWATGGGDVFLVDTDNNVIRRISSGGIVSTIAGKAGATGSTDGVGDTVRFDHPGGMVMDRGYGYCYVADTDNQTIRQEYYPSAPRILGQPQSQTVVAGATVQFSADATGLPAPDWQWYHNGVAISGATETRLTLTGVQASDAGEYYVTATNQYGTDTSSKATLTVNAIPSVSAAVSGGGGGGGALEWWFVLGLLGLAARRTIGAHRRGSAGQ